MPTACVSWVKPGGKPVVRYTHSPVVMHRDVVLDLQRYIEDRHRRDWMSAIVDSEMIMEYSTYGVFARQIDGLRRVTPTNVGITCAFCGRQMCLISSVISTKKYPNPKPVSLRYSQIQAFQFQHCNNLLPNCGNVPQATSRIVDRTKFMTHYGPESFRQSRRGCPVSRKLCTNSFEFTFARFSHRRRLRGRNVVSGLQKVRNS